MLPEKDAVSYIPLVCLLVNQPPAPILVTRHRFVSPGVGWGKRMYCVREKTREGGGGEGAWNLSNEQYPQRGCGRTWPGFGEGRAERLHPRGDTLFRVPAPRKRGSPLLSNEKVERVEGGGHYSDGKRTQGARGKYVSQDKIDRPLSLSTVYSRKLEEGLSFGNRPDPQSEHKTCLPAVECLLSN